MGDSPHANDDPRFVQKSKMASLKIFELCSKKTQQSDLNRRLRNDLHSADVCSDVFCSNYIYSMITLICWFM